MRRSLSLNDYAARIAETPTPAFAEITPLETVIHGVRRQLAGSGLTITGPADNVAHHHRELAILQMGRLGEFEVYSREHRPPGRPNKVLRDLIVTAVFMRLLEEKPSRGRRHRAHRAVAGRLGPYLAEGQVKHAVNRTLDRLERLEHVAVDVGTGSSLPSLIIRLVQQALDAIDAEHSSAQRTTAEPLTAKVLKTAEVISTAIAARRSLGASEASA